MIELVAAITSLVVVAFTLGRWAITRWKESSAERKRQRDLIEESAVILRELQAEMQKALEERPGQ